MAAFDELARLGVATVHEALDREGLVDLPLVQVVPGSRAAGPARTALCGPADNLMAHAAVAHARPGDVLVLTMTHPAPVALVGDLLVTQAIRQGVAALLVDGAIRDVEELQALGLPVWARWIRARGATKEHVGALDVAVTVGGAAIEPGDVVVLDADGAVAVPAARVDETLARAQERERSEVAAREQYLAGTLSYDTYGLRAIVEARTLD